MSKTKNAPPPQPKKLRVTCWNTSDPDAGVIRTLAQFEDGDTALDQETAMSKALHWLEDMLHAVRGFSLFEALDSIQAECNLDKDPPPFPDKTKMPLCIVNLVLKEYELELEEG